MVEASTMIGKKRPRKVTNDLVDLSTLYSSSSTPMAMMATSTAKSIAEKNKNPSGELITKR